MESILIDGSLGEGGGQILRTALSLSAISSVPFSISNIRDKRPNPGLQSQHISCINAVAKMCDAKVEGNYLHSSDLQFYPEKLDFSNSDLKFVCSTAGSTSLIAQTILPILIYCNKPINLTIIGGTDVLFSPSSSFFNRVFIPAINSIGFNVESSVTKYGFYPKGNGSLHIGFKGCKNISGFNLENRGELEELKGSAIVCKLSPQISQSMKSFMLKRLSESAISVSAKIQTNLVEADSAGCMNFLLAKYLKTNAGFGSLGEKGRPANKVAGQTINEFLEFNRSNACIQHFLADQLLIYLAFSDGKSNFSVDNLSGHILTNSKIISLFFSDDKMFNLTESSQVKSVQVNGKGKNYFKPASI